MNELSHELKEIMYRLFSTNKYKEFYPWWKCILKMSEFETVYYTQTERDEQVKLAMENINYPIIELCEWLLVNDIESTGVDSWKFNCGVDFTVNKVFHFNVEFNIYPDITNTKEEESLLRLCIAQGIRNTEVRFNNIKRKEVGEFLKGQTL